MSDAIQFRDVLPLLEADAAPDEAVIQQAFRAILDGAWTPVQVAGFAVALRVRGETPEVIAGAARALRSNMMVVRHDLERVLDTCGTGGDGVGTLNLSTGAAIIAAAAGVPVAKHGNRAVSSKAGSADVLEALGIPLDTHPEEHARLLREVGISFLMAPVHHPAMRHAGVARRELSVRTIFNCLGPLANPAQATHQLLGAYDDRLRPVLAQTLKALGVRRAWVVRGEDGMDELSPYAPTRVTELSAQGLRELRLTPSDFGITESAPGQARGGNAQENAAALEQILSGKPHPARDAVLLNAAGALVVSDELEPKQAMARVRQLIDQGRARDTLERWRKAATAARRVDS